jgi:hypothetical protein
MAVHQHRGRATNVDLLLHYQDPANVDAAVIAMDKFLLSSQTKPTLNWKSSKPINDNGFFS